jgi:hypothetical protein
MKKGIKPLANVDLTAADWMIPGFGTYPDTQRHAGTDRLRAKNAANLPALMSQMRSYVHQMAANRCNPRDIHIRARLNTTRATNRNAQDEKGKSMDLSYKDL